MQLFASPGFPLEQLCSLLAHTNAHAMRHGRHRCKLHCYSCTGAPPARSDESTASSTTCVSKMYFDQRFCSAANLSVPWWDKDKHKHNIIIQSVKRNTAVSLHGLAQRVESLTAVATSSENFFIISASCDMAIGVLTCWFQRHNSRAH